MNNPLQTAHRFNQALLGALDSYAEQPCLLVRTGKRYHRITYRQFHTLAFRLARRLHEHGIAHGERVAIVADNSLEWLVTYVATLLARGVAVPLRASLPGDTVCQILQDTSARLAVLQRPDHIASVAAALGPDALDRLFDLQAVLVVGAADSLPPEFARMSDVLSATHRLDPQGEQSIRQQALEVEPHDLATIYFVTSDSGRPRGAVFEQSQMMAQMHSLSQVFPFDAGDLVLTSRSWGEAHSLAPSLYAFVAGVPVVALAEEQSTMVDSLRQTSPTAVFATPHNLDQFYKSCMTWLSQQPESNRKVFQWALTKGQQYAAAGTEASPALVQAYRRAEMTFFNQLRGQLGGRLRYLYSTGATLPRQLNEFYEAIGVPVLNLYSLTETGCFPAATRPEAPRRGAAGQLAPGHEIRIADDDEIMVRSQTMMRGYWRRPDQTQQALDDDGWLGSGDLGYLDEDDFLFVTGRKEHLIVLSVGRKITPAPIEAALMASPLIAEAVVFGDNQPYLTALIWPPAPGAAGADVPPEAWPDQIKAAVARINHGLDSREKIKDFKILDAAAAAAGALRHEGRQALAQRFADVLADMYPATQSLQLEEVSQVQVDPERLRSLMEKESILDAWMEDAGIEFLFDLALAKQIDAPSMIHICDIAATIAQIESEEKPLSTAFIVGDPVRIARVLPESQVQLLVHDHIRRMRHLLVTMAQLVDGMVLGYVLDRYGYVRGIHKLDMPLPDTGGLLLGPQFRRHATISQECDALVFFVPYGGRQVRVFANGELVGRYANGDWSPDNLSQLDELVDGVAAEGRYNPGLLQRVLRCAFQMSESNLGAIFMLGDAERIMQGSDAAEISDYAAILSANLGEMSDDELINFAKQDGATVIDNSGTFRSCMVLLRPDAATRAQVGPGKGARHSSAAKMSREAACLAIAVSQDGPITVYDRGRRLLSL